MRPICLLPRNLNSCNYIARLRSSSVFYFCGVSIHLHAQYSTFNGVHYVICARGHGNPSKAMYIGFMLCWWYPPVQYNVATFFFFFFSRIEDSGSVLC